MKITADSGSDILSLKDIDFASVPLKICTAQREFVDETDSDCEEMVEFLKTYKDKSSTACPSVGDWLNAFGDSDEIFCVTMSNGVSGSYNSACVARERYLEKYPDRKVTVVDSYSAGPGQGIIIKKLEELINEGKSFEEVTDEILKYRPTLGTTFIMKSLKNFAANGRVKPSVAKIASVLGICVVCIGSDKGTIEPIKKVRGEKSAWHELYSDIKSRGYFGGRVCIDHCYNEQAANSIKNIIKAEFPGAEIVINTTRLLSSYYAEQGGVLVSYEKDIKTGM